MAEANATQNVVMTNEELAAKERALDLRLKELEVANKEYEQRHRPGRWFSVAGNPAVIAAMIAGWATFSAGLITWQSGRITAETQRVAALQQADSDFQKFEAGLVTDAVRTNDPDKAAVNLQFLLDSGLIKDVELRENLETYIRNRKPGTGQVQPVR